MKILTIIPLLLCLWATAQTNQNQKGELSGRVMDEKSTPLPYVNIVITDSAKFFLVGAITEENGTFNISDVPFGRLTIAISNFGYLPFSKELILENTNKKFDFGDLKLAPNLTVLNEVEIVGEKSTLLLKKDKKIFNVGKDVLAQSNSALEVLENIPSVTVSASGQVSLRGNSSVTVLINGRRSGLTLSNALAEIPAVNIERVEVITNPSSTYEAAGSGGILNIILKKNGDEGLNGQISVRAGLPYDYRLAPSISYKVKKINVFASAGYRYTDYRGTYTLKKAPVQMGAANQLTQQEDEKRHDDGRFFYGGMDYYFNDKTSITAAYNLNVTKDTDESDIAYRYFNQKDLDSMLLRKGTSVENRSYNQLELNFLKNHTQKGKKFSIDLQYDFWNSNKDWNIITNRELPSIGNTAKLRTNNKNGNNDFVLQSDYATPLYEKGKLEFGMKGEHRTVSNNYLAEHVVSDEWLTFNGLDNDLNYDETIGAAYVQYGNEIEKFNYEVGVRDEFTVIKIRDVNGLYTKDMDYNNLFPSVNVGYNLSENTNLQLSYSKRISRPSIWLLNPFNEIKDFTIQDAGNPQLKPAYTDAFEFGFNKNLKKISLISSLYYRITKGFFQNYIFQDANGSYITVPINLFKENKYGLEAAVNYSPIEKLKLGANFNLYTFDQKGTYDGKNLDFSNQFWELQLRAQVKFPKEINFQTFVHYSGKEVNAQTTIEPIWYANVSLNKSFFSKKLTIAFNVSNIFNSQVERLVTVNENYTLHRNSSRNAQRFNISLVYRLTNKQFKERQTKTSNRN